MAALFVLAYMIFVAPFVRAFVLRTLWGWFIVPTFGVNPIGMAAAYGLALFTSVLVGSIWLQKGESDSKGEPEFGSIILKLILEPTLTLLFGWIAHSFM